MGITVTAGSTVTLEATLWDDNGSNTDGAGMTISSTNVYGGPGFADPAAYDYHLTAGSAAIDRGVTTAGVTTDLDGVPRDMVPDLGAYEFQRICQARLNDDLTEYATVQAAVDDSTLFTDTVKVAGYCVGVNDYGGLSQSVYLSKTLTIQGGYTLTNWLTPDPVANLTTLDAQGLGRVVFITGTITPTITGLRLTGGDATGLGGARWGRDAGGGVYVYTATVTISDCIVFSNTASLTSTAYGGGLFFYGSDSRVESNTILSNTASTTSYGYGGGLSLELSDITFKNNVAWGNTASVASAGRGGGLYLHYCDAEMLDNKVGGNVASINARGLGGGLHIYSSVARLEGNYLISNTASYGEGTYGYGGGLYAVENDVTLGSNIVASNTATYGSSSYGYGGGLYLQSGDARLEHNTILSNTAAYGEEGQGGGIHLANCDAVMMDNSVVGNIASIDFDGKGGGLYLDDSDSVLEGSTVVGNIASAADDGYGGGLYIFKSSSTLTSNSVISNSATLSVTADGLGGGLYIWMSSPFTLTSNVIASNHANTHGSGLWFGGEWNRKTNGRLLHTTIANNSSSGQGAYVGDYATLAFTNTIIAGHAGVGITVTAGSTATLEATLWHENGANTGGAGTIISSTNVYGDPAFADSTANDYHLTAGSAALDQGVETAAEVTTDLDGLPRDAIPDLGAYEYQRVCQARLNDDPTEYATVQAAVDDSTLPTDTVKVAGYCAGVNDYGGLSQSVYLTKSLTIQGGYTLTNWSTPDPVVNPTTLDALGQGRVMYIHGAITPTITGLRLTGGDASGLGGGPSGYDAGGGVYVQQASATISGCRVYSNTATHSAASIGYGGGIYLNESGATLNGNTVASNTIGAKYSGCGGGLYLNNSDATLMGNAVVSNTTASASGNGYGAGLYLNYSDASLASNTVEGNTASDISWGYGGGLYLNYSGATLISNTVASNKGSSVHYGNGGGLYLNYSSDAWLESNVVKGNLGGVSSSNSGGGLYLYNSAATLVSNTVASNTAGAGSGSGYGGGIMLYDSDAELRGNTVVSNTASVSSSGSGGGLYLNGSDATLIGNVVISNTSTFDAIYGGYGGGLYIYSDSKAWLESNTVAGNLASTASYATGGGVYIAFSKATLISNTVVNNTASAAGSGRGGGVYVTYEGATLTGNTIISNTASVSSDGHGGGVYVIYANSTLINNRVISNTGSVSSDGHGGGVYLYYSNSTLRGNRVVSNTASVSSTGTGGGMYLNYAGASLESNTVAGNRASASSDGYGGGLTLYRSAATLTGNSVLSNTAGISTSYGGGLYLDMSDASLENNVVKGNTASVSSTGSGGGLYLNVSDASLESNTVVSNSATLSATATGQGGGLYVSRSGPLTLINNLVADNHATTRGSGLWFSGTLGMETTGQLLHTTIADNLSSGQGVFVGEYTTLAFTNTILSGHASVGITVTTGSTATLEATLWRDNGVDTGGGAGAVISSTNVYGDPAFVDPAANDYHLTAGSAAIDRGVETTAGVTTDLDGLPRDQRPDLGAYELQRICQARLNDDPTEYATVQAAVDDSTLPTDTVKVAGYCAGVNDYGGLSQSVYLTKTLTIQGGYTLTNWVTPDPEAYPTTLDAMGLGRVMVISGTITPTISGLRLTGGDATGMGGALGGYDAGGGVYVYTASVSISDCIVFSNTASADSRGYGGGMHLFESSARLEGNTIFSNTASAASYGYGGGLNFDYSILTLDNNKVWGNTASVTLGGYGGGIAIRNSDAVMQDNQVRGNAASIASTGFGGGLYLYWSSAGMESNHVVSNTATYGVGAYGYGGGLYSDHSDATFRGNNVAGNTAVYSPSGFGFGGGFHIQWGAVTLISNTVVSNAAAYGDGAHGEGGGIHLDFCDAVMMDNDVAGNMASVTYEGYGGGLYLNSSDAGIESSTVAGNVASVDHDGYGGGLYVYRSGFRMDSTHVVSNSATLSDTAIGEGGGLYIWGSEPFTLTNNVIADNHANTNGSGIWFGGESGMETDGRLVHLTIADNRSSGQGVHVGEYTTLAITNTIIAGHHGVGITVTTGSTATLEATLWHDNGANTGGGGHITSTGHITGTPIFLDPDAWDYHIHHTSPAVGAGVDAGVDEDIDGHARPLHGYHDIGADEVHLSPHPADLVITKTVTPTSIYPGEVISYRLEYLNLGPQIATGVLITDLVPISLTEVSYTSSGAAITQIEVGVLTYAWSVADLFAGEGGVITITGRLGQCLPVGAIISNTANISSEIHVSSLAVISGSIHITVTNGPPVVVDDRYETYQNTKLVVPVPHGVLRNDSDPNCDPLEASLLTIRAPGSVALNPDGSFVYTPTTDLIGSEQFGYQVCDDASPPACATGVLAFDVLPAPPPVGGVLVSLADRPGDGALPFEVRWLVLGVAMSALLAWAGRRRLSIRHRGQG